MRGQRKAPTASEAQVQAAFVAEFRGLAGPDCMIFSIPNEHPAAWVGRLTGLGMLEGMPDTVILWPPGRLAFLEMKSEGGRLSYEQRDVHAQLRRLGFMVGVARSQADAWELVAEWGVPTRRRIEDGRAVLV